jgi:hypothetical protein
MDRSTKIFVNLIPVLKRVSLSRTIFILFLFSSFLCSVSPILHSASAQTTPPILAGWNRSSLGGSGSDGVPFSGGSPGFTSPVVADLDGNNGNGLEVVVAGADGMLHAFHADGSSLWNVALPSRNCGSTTNRVFSSPSVGKLFGDGVPYIVIGYGGFVQSDCDGGVVAIKGSDGSTKWKLSLKSFAKKEKFYERFRSVISTPTLADVDGDGKLEIGFGAFDRNVYLVEANGKVRWYYNAADTIWSSPTFVNINSTPELEMIIGTDISGNKRLKPITKDGGILYALQTKKRARKKAYFRDPSLVIWQRPFDQVLYSTPVVGELIASSPGQEIVIGSGCFFPQGNSNKRGKWFKIISAKSGKVIRTLTTENCSSGSAALGDVNNDGKVDVVTLVPGSPSRVIAWDANSGAELWNVVPADRGENVSDSGSLTSPIIGDLDGNGSLEVIVAHGSSILIFNGENGSSLSCQARQCSSSTPLLRLSSSMRSAPALGDVNQDGIMDLVAVSGNTQNSLATVWTNFASVLDSPAGASAPYFIPWANFRGDQLRSGR